MIVCMYVFYEIARIHVWQFIWPFLYFMYLGVFLDNTANGPACQPFVLFSKFRERERQSDRQADRQR